MLPEQHCLLPIEIDAVLAGLRAPRQAVVQAFAESGKSLWFEVQKVYNVVETRTKPRFGESPMFPVEFDHTVLDGLPLPAKEDESRISRILKVVVSKRIIPYFRKHRGTDPIVSNRVLDQLSIVRLEDESNRVRLVAIITRTDKDLAIRVHERVFDYLAFVIPGDPEATLGGGTVEERKMLAFSEFMLRHELQHLLYPDHTEREVIQADVEFAMNRRVSDPTYYRALRNALADEMNGIKGRQYLHMFDCAERDQPVDEIVSDILSQYPSALADFPDALLDQVLPFLDMEVTTKVLGVCYRRSRDTSYSLLKRTGFLRSLLRLFAGLIAAHEKRAEEVFNAFRESWGLVFLFQELDLPEAAVHDRSSAEIFQLFKESLQRFSQDIFIPPTAVVPEPKPSAKEVSAPTVKSLKDRIEEARNDPAIPRQVIEVIDKNKLNAVGHSGSKYSELIETLLAIPWGVIHKISVLPEDFERGLNLSHYGLEKPKELLCDFFANLVWRYRRFDARDIASWQGTGSAFLFVGPPGVGKTSLAISIANNLGIPFHKVSLGGMRDEADLKGHGFTYEGSKPGAIVQGLIKMGMMNGMFILDEADKMEKFAVATLLEILDPEQNHLFHDKYTETTVDIDLSNCHFVLTANTLETVPPPVVNRCEVVQLDRYSVDEKVAIAKQYLIRRVRSRYGIGQGEIRFDPETEEDLLRFLIRTYTYEAGVRELERIIRTLFLRLARKEILSGEKDAVVITRATIKQYLDPPRPPRPINEEDRVGEMMGLGVNVELGIGTLMPIQATPIRLHGETEGAGGYLSMVHATGNIQKIMDESRKVATTAILHCSEALGIRMDRVSAPIHLHFMGASTSKDGPSAGGAIALALASVLSGRPLRRDVAMTGEIDTQGRITRVGALDIKLETACDAGCRTVIIPTENLFGEDGIERLSDALRDELQVLTYLEWKGAHPAFDYQRHTLQVVAVDHILEAAHVAFVHEEELTRLETMFAESARMVAEFLSRGEAAKDQCLCALYVKDAGELDCNELSAPFPADHGNVLLVRPEARIAVKRKLPELHAIGRLHDFDPSKDDLSLIIQKIDSSIPGGLKSVARLSMVAPFFALKQNFAQIKEFARGPLRAEFRLFANNYALQGVKIKACKPVLNRAFCYLMQLDAETLGKIPFLSTEQGVHVVDLSFIPEK